jgi:hypothetical protein
MQPNTDHARNKRNEQLHVISVKYRLSLPDDRSYMIRNMLGVIFNVCLLDFYITRILTPTVVLI